MKIKIKRWENRGERNVAGGKEVVSNSGPRRRGVFWKGYKGRGSGGEGN